MLGALKFGLFSSRELIEEGSDSDSGGNGLFYALYNFGGINSDPAVADTISVWDASKSTSNEDYGVLGGNGINVIAVNGPVDGPPTLSTGQYWGWKSGNTNKAYNMTVTGSNLYPNDVMNECWFSDNSPAGIRFTGLSNGTYTVKIVSLTTGEATTRTSRFNINGGSDIDVISNTTDTADVITSESEHMAVETGIVINDGVLHIKIDLVGGQFCFMNAVEIIQTA